VSDWWQALLAVGQAVQGRKAQKKAEAEARKKSYLAQGKIFKRRKKNLYGRMR